MFKANYFNLIQVIIGVSHAITSLFNLFFIFVLIVCIFIFIMQLPLYLNDLYEYSHKETGFKLNEQFIEKPIVVSKPIEYTITKTKIPVFANIKIVVVKVWNQLLNMKVKRKLMSRFSYWKNETWCRPAWLS